MRRVSFKVDSSDVRSLSLLRVPIAIDISKTEDEVLMKDKFTEQQALFVVASCYFGIRRCGFFQFG